MKKTPGLAIMELDGHMLIRGLYPAFSFSENLPEQPSAWLFPNMKIDFQEPGENFGAAPLDAGQVIEADKPLDAGQLMIKRSAARLIDRFFGNCIDEAIDGAGLTESQHWILICYESRDEYNRRVILPLSLENGHPADVTPLYAWRASTRGTIRHKIREWLYSTFIWKRREKK